MATRGSEVDRAILRAAQAHAGQRRKGSRAPYVVHPIEVVKRLADLGVTDVAVLAAGALHDVVEDTEVTLDEVRSEFGDRIAELVDEMTHDLAREDKVAYLEAFERRSPESLALKLVDRACNVDDYVRFEPHYAPYYARKALVIYDAVAVRRGELEVVFGRETTFRMVEEAERLRALAERR